MIGAYVFVCARTRVLVFISSCGVACFPSFILSYNRIADVAKAVRKMEIQQLKDMQRRMTLSKMSLKNASTRRSKVPSPMHTYFIWRLATARRISVPRCSHSLMEFGESLSANTHRLP